MTATKIKSVQLRDLFYALSLEKPVPDAEVLDKFIRLYPEHAAALTEFAIELAMDAIASETENLSCPDESFNAVSPAVSRAMSRFQNRLYDLQNAKTNDNGKRSIITSPQNPFAALCRTSFRSFARRLNANTVFVSKLRDRQIDPDTMTEGFRNVVADELEVSIGVLNAHFEAQPQIQTTSQYFKADQKPEVGARQTFKEAVQNSGLTPDQQHHLLNL